MITRAQLLNDPEEAMRYVLDGRQSSIWTAMPGIIKAVDLAAMTCEVQPSIQGTVQDEDGAQQPVNLPLLIHVPLVFPNAGGFILTFPVAVGDEVLVVFASRCIDAWWQNGGNENRPMEARMHDLSDGFAIPGPRSQPRVVHGGGTAISSTRVEIRNDAGTVFYSIGTKFAMKNATTDLKTILSDLQSLLNTFMGVLAALPNDSNPVVNSVLRAPGTSAVASLATLNTKINALLESS